MIELNPARLIQGDAAIVEIYADQSICIEEFSQYASLGRIILHDGGDPHCCNLIIGIVKEVTRREEVIF